jgi:hypothetical protein
MSQTPILESDIPNTRRGPGRQPRYDTKLIPRKVGYPPQLLTKLEQEATLRNVREGKPDAWSVSRVVVEDLAKLYGIDLASEDVRNGRARD